MNNYEKFKGRGPFRTEIAIVAVLIAIITVLFVIPRNERKTELSEEPTIFFIESIDIPQVKLQELKIPPPKPVIPVMDEDVDLTIDTALIEWLFDDPTLQDDPPPPPGDVNEEDTVIFIPYEEPPVPIGGPGAIARNIVYPQAAKDIGIEGAVVIQTYIDKTGKVINCIVWKGMPGSGFDEAAMAAIKKTPFKPAIQRDKPVGVWIAIPVVFKLSK